MKDGYYAVQKGREPGVYTDWESCKDQVNGYSNCKFKKFATVEEANAFADVKPNSYYAVSNGRETGVYKSWHQAEMQVTGYSHAAHKRFNTFADAQNSCSGNTNSTS